MNAELDRTGKPRTSFKCSVCKDEHRIKNKDGEYEACDCIKRRHLQTYAPIMVDALSKVSAEFVDSVEKFFLELNKEEQDLSRVLLNLQTNLSSDEVEVFCLYWLLWQHVDKTTYQDFAELRIIDLVDIFFSHHIRIENLSDLESRFPLVVVKCGWGDPKFSHYVDIVDSFLGAFDSKRTKIIFVVSKGTFIYQSWLKSFERYKYLDIDFPRQEKGKSQAKLVKADPEAVEENIPTKVRSSKNFKADVR